jgi:hypothetical protein
LVFFIPTVYLTLAKHGSSFFTKRCGFRGMSISIPN